ncbi:galactokinase [Parenemella sanctibonifatiensis]|uniref:galactokinase n=1 Tax=Parenemella sanctibonifatiensis TaxID=2016505 RepID=UPI001E33006F|nr:galactokinase [Parenemella sanctibonifatiensis]
MSEYSPVTEHEVDALAELHRHHHGSDPVVVWAAPGRVNLIGEHTDYNGGFVMPFALRQSAVVVASPQASGWTVASELTGERHHLEADQLQPGTGGWQAYLFGVVWALREAGHDVVPAALTLRSDVPVGAGLSSSAAIECAALGALADLSGLELDGLTRAKLAQRAENAYVGAPTGLLDQAASTLCTEGHMLFFDCDSLTGENIPLPLAQRRHEILVLDTNTPHSHVDGEYAERRAGCEEAARRLGVPTLRQVTDPEQALADLADDDRLHRYARHVLTENDRVLQAVTAGRDADFAALGPLLDASHVSMRQDYRITVATVDAAVETAREAGALGARMTGGGFGGCIIALCRAGESDRIGAAVADRFAREGWTAPEWFSVTPGPGARRVN